MGEIVRFANASSVDFNAFLLRVVHKQHCLPTDFGVSKRVEEGIEVEVRRGRKGRENGEDE